ncbi:MAG: DUF4170 domain-containing protein [Pseudomonadota bacterium]|nr:DUF4170 domain-containing protein [Pseudomonadota bacterium]
MGYWVVGGIYKDTSFKDIEDGSKLKKLGPFKSYSEAKKIWEKVSWEDVDNCNARYIILPHK